MNNIFHFIIFSVSIVSVFAQTKGTISGSEDNKTGEGLPWNLKIKGTYYGAHVFGNFKIQNINHGTYQLMLHCLDIRKQLTGIVVSEEKYAARY